MNYLHYLTYVHQPECFDLQKHEIAERYISDDLSKDQYVSLQLRRFLITWICAYVSSIRHKFFFFFRLKCILSMLWMCT